MRRGGQNPSPAPVLLLPYSSFDWRSFFYARILQLADEKITNLADPLPTINYTMKKILFLLLILLTSSSLSLRGQPYSTYYHQKASLFQQLPTTKGAIVFLGDSITDGCEWGELFGNQTIKNRGISGDVTQGVMDRLSETLIAQPTKLFLMIGVNDLAQGKTVEFVVAKIKAILDRIRLESPGTKVYLQSLLPVNPDFGKFNRHVNKQVQILAVNQELAKLAGSNCQYVDLYSHFVSEDNKLNPAFTNDGLHLTSAGDQQWAAQITSVVNTGNMPMNAAYTPQEEALGSVFEPMRIRDITVWSPTYPVLIGKDHNPVLRIQVDATGFEKALTLSALTISLAGSDEVQEVEEVNLFFTGQSPDFDSSRPHASPVKGQQQITFPGNAKLRPGSNYFWISYRLAENANVSHKLGAQFVEATIDKQTLKVPYEVHYPLKKMGHALRKHQQDGIHTYRIPGLVTTNKGTLIGVYDNRRNGSVDLQEDVDIGMSRSTDGGQSWEPMKVIMDMGEWGGKPQEQNGIGDPSILLDRQTNTIWVAAVWAHGHPGKRNWWASKPGLEPEQTSQFVLVKSEDDGKTWSEPINITKQIKKPEWHLLLEGPGKGITLKNGTLVFPAQFKDKNEIPHSTIIYSKDRGKSWTIGTGAKSETTEAQVVELSDGSLMLNMRDNRGDSPGGKNGTGARSVAITKDLGKTWTEHPTTRKALPEPVCMASLINHDLGEKTVLLFSNPEHRYVRKNMTIKLSWDEGMTWPKKHQLLIDEGRGRGYSCMTSIDERTIGILYEGSQSDLIFQKIDLTELLE